MTLPPLGLYVHLPWCERKCPYCDFNSHEYAALPESAYIAALLEDLDRDRERVGGRVIETVFIGGGTPSLFSAAAIEDLLRGIAARVALAAGAEITLEANPGSSEADRFADFRAAGVNRLSLGIQSFDDACLHELGRVHDRARALDAVDAARAAGFDNLNLDLMHGLPGQSSTQAAADLRTAIALQPEHLSWYQLTIEPNTVFFKRPPTLPVEDELAAIQDAGESLLAAAGYAQYEVSAYSRAGQQCRHNLNYWQFGDYLGIGAGAHGKLTGSDGTVTRFTRRRQPDDYLAAAAAQRVAGTRRLCREELVGEFMLNALRLNAGFPMTLFSQRTGLADDVISARLDGLRDRGLLEVNAGRVRATGLGRRFLDSVVAEFLDG
jgi:oxygen-independent coproporphyrinogen-3 oxidase